MQVQLNPAAALRPIESVVSASFLYPFKGIYYYLAHPAFYPLFGRRLIPLVITSIVVLGLLFTFTYLPQVAFLAIFHGHLAWFNAAFLVLGEGQVVIALLFEALLVDETLVNVFDVSSLLPHASLQITNRNTGSSHKRTPNRSCSPSTHPLPRSA